MHAAPNTRWAQTRKFRESGKGWGVGRSSVVRVALPLPLVYGGDRDPVLLDRFGYVPVREKV